MFLRFVRLQWTGNSWSENKIKIEPIHVQQMGGKQHRPRILSKCHETVFYQERTNRSGRQEDEGGKGRKKCRQSLVWQIINSATPCLSQEGTCSCNPKTNLSRLSAYLLLCHPIQHTSSLPLPLCVHPKFESPPPSYRPGATKKTTDKLSFTFFGSISSQIGSRSAADPPKVPPFAHSKPTSIRQVQVCRTQTTCDSNIEHTVTRQAAAAAVKTTSTTSSGAIWRRHRTLISVLTMQLKFCFYFSFRVCCCPVEIFFLSRG